MKRKGIIALIASALALAACASEPEFTDEEIERLESVQEAFSEDETPEQDGRVAMQPYSGPPTSEEELATTQVKNNMEAVGVDGMTNMEILEYGRKLCTMLDTDPGKLHEEMGEYHAKSNGRQATIMIPPVTAREFCPAYFPSDEELEVILTDVWGGEIWVPGVN
ncbi:hypothetical protein [Corynebacterium sp. A21]|uniref:hypothetical protein n=1 Tax=Corynebacterium sp. A21 TaxID=3457318 RepID=UPI003FD4C429